MAEAPEHAAWQRLQDALERLDRRVSALEQAQNRDVDAPAEQRASEKLAEPQRPPRAAPETSSPEPKISLPPPPAELEGTVSNRSFPGGEPSQDEPLFASSSRDSWEKLIGGRWMTWLGAVSLALAVAFFVPWAWQHFHWPDWARVLIFHLAGMGLLGAAHLLQRRQLPVLARGLAGLGIFTLYASAFAMEHLYHLFADSGGMVAWADCALITAAAIVIAVRNDSVFIISLATLGGYVTPLIAAPKHEAFAATFGFLAFLNIGLVATAVLRGWNFLKPIGVAATAWMFLIWVDPGRLDVWQVERMLLLHAAIFLLGVTLPPLWWQRRTTGADHLALSANSLWLVGATWMLFHQRPDQQLAAVCWAMSALHATLFAWIYSRVTHADRMPRLHLALAAVFFTLAVPLQMRDTLDYLAYAWALEGLAFTAIGIYFRDQQMAHTGSAVFALALVRALGIDLVARAETVGNSAVDRRLLVMLGTGAVMMVAGSCYWWLDRLAPRREAPRLRRADGGCLMGLGNLLILLGFTCQWDGRLVLLLWTIDAAIAWAAAFYSGNRAVRIYALLLSVLLVGSRVLYHGDDVTQPFRLLLNDRFGSLALVALVYFAASWQLRKITAAAGAIEQDAAVFLHVMAHSVLLAAIFMEVHNGYQPTGGGPASMAEQATYSVVGALYAAALVAAGFLLKYRLPRLLGLLGLLAVALKVFFVDLAELSLMPRVLALGGLGVLLLITSFWYQKFIGRIELEDEA